jgi:AraC-like DNA-binding protein
MSRTRRSADLEIYPRLCRARAFIDSNYNLPLKLDQISSEACFSRYHFIRLFRQAFNQTPHQYLTQKRIDRAKELLASSDLSVTAVCFEVGFESVGSFSSLFRKCVGDSPISYRSRSSGLQGKTGQFHCVPVPGCFLIRFGLAQQL